MTRMSWPFIVILFSRFTEIEPAREPSMNRFSRSYWIHTRFITLESAALRARFLGPIWRRLGPAPLAFGLTADWSGPGPVTGATAAGRRSPSRDAERYCLRASLQNPAHGSQLARARIRLDEDNGANAADVDDGAGGHRLRLVRPLFPHTGLNACVLEPPGRLGNFESRSDSRSLVAGPIQSNSPSIAGSASK